MSVEGSKAYQVDDLVVAGRQDIAAVIVEGLVWLSGGGAEWASARGDIQHSAGRTSGFRRRGCQHTAASHGQRRGSIS